MAHAQATGSRLSITGTIDGHDIHKGGSDNPIKLDPKKLIPVDITIRNLGDQPESIRYVRLEGKALGLTFLTYDLGVKAVLQPKDRTNVQTKLDFFDLESQATGYLGTSVRVYDSDGFLIARTVRRRRAREAELHVGSFAVIVFGTGDLQRRGDHREHDPSSAAANRFIRGAQFAMAGSTIGITLSFGVSILRIGFADVDEWVRIVLTPTGIAFALVTSRQVRCSAASATTRPRKRSTSPRSVAVARTSGVNEAVAADVLANIGRPGGRRSTSNDMRSSKRTSSSLRASRKTGDDLHSSLRSSARQSKRTGNRQYKPNTKGPDEPAAD